MNNFIYKNPTKIIFGKGQIEQINTELPKDARILMVYGGGSIKRNGVYEQVIRAVGNRKLIEFPNVPANPEYDHLIEAVKIIREEKLNYILAIGGGSVIDGTKFISAAAKYDGEDPWQIVCGTAPIKKAIPFGTVLTIPATGSEMNAGAVISRRALKEKRPFDSPLVYPQFSVLDPQVMITLPTRQIANGIVDATMHVLEQYMTYPVGGHLQDRFAEGIMKTLIEEGPKVMANPANYEAAASLMWSCTLALNGLIAQGVPTDWGVHAIGHEFTAIFGIDHARTLAIVAPRYYEYLLQEKREKLVQYANRVWNISSGNDDERALQGIQKLENFCQSLGINTHLSDYTEEYEGTAEEIEKRFIERKWSGIGERAQVTPEDVKKIVLKTYK
ncbi:Alcohol dehydrogenase YqhD [Bacteroides pyogenes]|uniref:NADH-dependent butanol dehydrogenase A n=2 Tax=Bacteroides pyogenes TaxID=310300 RepID=W4PL60_9BACE|nr:iron-containing alcohol dehydrogenase [Bacteroides pyogenes]GAE17125.1 NADH-dependent butanol dehydrogenase A [Bacteroides pyogenes JCM 6292]MBR8705293.1 Alcohol dehydrogenase YqhD [Bacteroides pyogenes]MBR8720718.1 Alcohol dehydrogenase YqhD [Bacteroides pyogenes]MBR8724225.1 Alcohol dehydrogenase YqhD [Bacteroides pyogenes]MBR8737440.1 Alcohol dehydrogenase YqhD [Bacteroides pyogenes]